MQVPEKPDNSDMSNATFSSDGMMNEKEVRAAATADKDTPPPRHVSFSTDVRQAAGSRVRSHSQKPKSDQPEPLSREEIRKQSRHGLILLVCLAVLFGAARVVTRNDPMQHPATVSEATGALKDKITAQAGEVKETLNALQTASEVAQEEEAKAKLGEENQIETAAPADTAEEKTKKSLPVKGTQVAENSDNGKVSIAYPGLYKLSEMDGIAATDAKIQDYLQGLNLMVYLSENGEANMIAAGQYVKGVCSSSLMTFGPQVMKYSLDENSLILDMNGTSATFIKYADDMPAGLAEVSAEKINNLNH